MRRLLTLLSIIHDDELKTIEWRCKVLKWMYVKKTNIWPKPRRLSLGFDAARHFLKADAELCPGASCALLAL